MIDDRVFSELEEEDGADVESTVKTCGHPACACLMQEEEVFCSDECEKASPDSDECPCGHLACEAEAEGGH